MRRFLFGAYCMASVWAWYEWHRNPHGHRGGHEAVAPKSDREVMNALRLAGDLASLPVRYHRTG